MTCPVIVAPMFLISNPKMVIESCKEGFIGAFPALNARSSSILGEWMMEIKSTLVKYKNEFPDEKVALWGINFIAHKSNKRYNQDLELIKKHQPPLVITSLGDPSPVVEIVHEYGGIVFSDVITPFFAKKAVEKGTDGLILVANGAGGHGGELNPFAFINEVRRFFEGPVVLAGALSKGEDILAAEVMGADFAYIGSRFISVNESTASEEYKKMVISSNCKDIIYTNAFSGIHGSYLIPSIRKAGLDPSNLQATDKINFDKTSQTNVKVWKDIWGAGQGIGMVNTHESISTAAKKLCNEYNAAKQKL